MTAHYPRLFKTDAAVLHVGDGLILRTLPRPEWTHEAHLAACTYILRDRPDIVPEYEMRDIISRYNESVGGINDDTQGFHESITRCFMAGVRLHLGERPANEELHVTVNALLLSERGRRDWPLRFYSRYRLFSVEARRSYIEPDLAPFG